MEKRDPTHLKEDKASGQTQPSKEWQSTKTIKTGGNSIAIKR